MKHPLALFLSLSITLLMTAEVFSQGNGHPGGGGPSHSSEEKLAYCMKILDEAKELEISFLRLEGMKIEKIEVYDEKLFFDKIQSLSLGCMTQVIGKIMGTQDKPCTDPAKKPEKLSNEKAKILSEILTIWETGVAEPKKCEEVFLKRSHQLVNLRFVVSQNPVKKSETKDGSVGK